VHQYFVVHKCSLRSSRSFHILGTVVIAELLQPAGLSHREFARQIRWHRSQATSTAPLRFAVRNPDLNLCLTHRPFILNFLRPVLAFGQMISALSTRFFVLDGVLITRTQSFLIAKQGHHHLSAGSEEVSARYTLRAERWKQNAGRPKCCSGAET